MGLRSTDPDAKDPDDDPANRRAFTQWMVEQTAQREALTAAACHFIDCGSVQCGLAPIPETSPQKLVAIGTPQQIGELLAEHEKAQRLDGP